MRLLTEIRFHVISSAAKCLGDCHTWKFAPFATGNKYVVDGV